jgi:hypothetical protein
MPYRTVGNLNSSFSSTWWMNILRLGVLFPTERYMFNFQDTLLLRVLGVLCG